IMIPVQTFALGNAARVVMYTHGKMTPMLRTLYAKAEYGDITRTSPEARRVNTCTCAVAVARGLAKTSPSPTVPAPSPAGRYTVLRSPTFCPPHRPPQNAACASLYRLTPS